MIMFASLITWWYGPGLQQRLHAISRGLDRWLDLFSFGLIVRTLFAPFRQIDAGGVSGAIDVQFRAWLDRMFSRVIGFFVRTALLIAGTVWIAVMLLLYALQILAWLLLPIMPFICIGLFVTGWIPWQL